MIPTPNELFAMFERGEIEREVLVALSEVPDFRERTPAPSAPRSESGLPRWSYRFFTSRRRARLMDWASARERRSSTR
jgi:hypothetical protein